MLPVSSPEDCSRPGESVEEEPCYTELQSFTGYMGSLITSSTDPCLGDFPEEVCVEYIVSTENLLPLDDLTAGCSTVYTLPDSPQSLSEEDCSLTAQDLLQTHLYEDSQVYDDEDDDASVMLDLMDLSFLDEDTRSVEEEQDLDYAHCFTDSIDTCPTVIVAAARSCTPDFRQFTPSPCPSPPMPTPSPSPCPSPTQSSATQAAPSLVPLSPVTTITPTTVLNIPLPSTPTSSSPSSMTFHYYDSTISTATSINSTITILDSRMPAGTKANAEHSLLPSSLPLPALSTINYNNNNNNQDIICLRPMGAGATVSCRSNSSSSSSSGDGERREIQHHHHQQQQQPAEEEDEVEDEGDTSTGMDFDTFDNSDDDENEEERDYKPYCGSRRGAKKNLLWKFLLWSLDHHSDVVSWTDIPKGVFKFVDTTRVSTLWGQRKKKQDMTFEKLSRGIRHYYKRGLMERMPHTRLVYKFNWDKVPKRYRKA